MRIVYILNKSRSILNLWELEISEYVRRQFLILVLLSLITLSVSIDSLLLAAYLASAQVNTRHLPSLSSKELGILEKELTLLVEEKKHGHALEEVAACKQ